MKHRALGTSDLQVAPLAFGGNVFGWSADEATSFSLLDAFVESGFNLLDTADVYSRWVPGHVGGESELLIGKWLKKSGKRNRIVLATKVGKDMGDGKVGLSAKYIAQAVDASLKRLQTDHIDLYQSHDDDKSVPLEESLEAFGRLIQAGKVRAIGASNYEAPRLAEALKLSRDHGLPRYDTLQPLFNLIDRAPYEAELQALCVKEGVGVINFYGLASGFLTGKYRSAADLEGRTRGGRVKQYLNERGLRILAALDEVAESHQATPAQVALAWEMAQPGIVAPIASATSLAQWADIARSATLELSEASIGKLTRASEGG